MIHTGGNVSWFDYPQCLPDTDLSCGIIRDGDQPGVVVGTPGHAGDFSRVTTQPAMRLRHHQRALWRILCAERNTHTKCLSLSKLCLALSGGVSGSTVPSHLWWCAGRARRRWRCWNPRPGGRGAPVRRRSATVMC